MRPGNAAEGGEMLDERADERFDPLIGDERDLDPPRVLQTRGEEVDLRLRPVLVGDKARISRKDVVRIFGTRNQLSTGAPTQQADYSLCWPICVRWQTQVPLRKRDTGTRFQISLEGERARFVGERDNHVGCPWPVLDGVHAMAGVVRCKTCGNVRRHAGVVVTGIGLTSQHVNKPL
jgi:hypothetical protein